MKPPARLIGVAVAWLLFVGLIRLFALAPEQCSPPQPAEIDQSVELAIDWFAHNQLPDGRFVYAYERDGEADRSTQLVRHHGVMVSLYQASVQDFDGAFELAEGALEWSLEHLVEVGDGARAVGFEGDDLPTGATALLVAALVERERATGRSYDDELLVDLGRFLLANVTPDGAVSKTWRPGSGPVGDRSRFLTGEVMWALSMLAEASPAGPTAPERWATEARRIGHHIALDRDRVEGRIALTHDHWAAYGLDQVAVVAGPATEIEVALARRNAGLISLRTRLESQNPDSGPIRVMRGAHSLGAGVGTLGEGLAGLIRLADTDDRLADLREPMRDTLACVSDLLVARQLTAADADPDEDAGLVAGAWFRYGRTQQDDQQHALSALLAARQLLDGSEERANKIDHDDAAGWVVLALALMAATDPIRARVARRRREASSTARPPWWRTSQALRFAAVALPVAVLASPLLDWADMSEPTVRLAAGLVVAATATVDVVAPPRTGASVMRPGPFVVLLAAGVDPGVPGALVAIAATMAAVALAESTVWPRREPDHDRDEGSGWSPRLVLAARFVAGAALVFGLDLAVDGVFEL